METILSVGIDIGTTTTQVVFSRLSIQNTAGYFSVPKISIVDKQVLYVGDPHFTPLTGESQIDAQGVKAVVEGEYARAAIDPKQVRAGAVIITGESARKDNARAIVESLSEFAGEFVVSAAGPDMEAVIAGKGSGAYAYSKAHRRRVMNVDIGGGTTNAVLFDGGRTISTGCLDVGGRLVRTDGQGRVSAFSPAAKKIGEENGIPLFQGMWDVLALKRLCAAMAVLIAQQAGALPKTSLYAALKTPGSGDFNTKGPPEALCFSGGVADAVYGRFSEENPFRFGDIGILLGRSVSENAAIRSIPLMQGEATIRATVIGAGSYTTTVSGSTISASEELLPIRDLPVYRITSSQQERLFQGDAEAFIRSYGEELHRSGTRLAVAMEGRVNPSYLDVRRLAHALSEGADACLQPDQPLIVLMEADMAKALGQCLRQQTKRPVLSVDGIAVEAQDRIDLGKPVMGGLAVPVVIKTLLFEK